MAKKLEGKIAVITGGSAGIGLGTAKRFAAESARVFITGRRRAELDKAVSEIGGNVIGIQGDAAKLADIEQLALGGLPTSYNCRKADIPMVRGIVRWAGSSEVGRDSARHDQRYSTGIPVRAILRSKRYPHRRASRQVGLYRTR
jgi:hypothetical protein